MESPNTSTSLKTTTATTTTDTTCTLKEVDGNKRKVASEQEAMKKRPKVVVGEAEKDVAQDDRGNSKEGHTVCKFVVKNLKARRGYASSDYSVSLLVGKHGLYNLVLKVFDILIEKNLTEDDYYSHLWSIVFDDIKYHYGWRKSPGGPTNPIDEQDILPLKDLPIQVGQKGKFWGESGTFDFVVEEVDGAPEQDVEYPKYSAIQISFSSHLSDDWISEPKKRACLKARDAWCEYYNGSSNSSKSVGTYWREIVACKPLAPRWSPGDFQLLGLCMNAGHKFTKSWKMILQYCLVGRPQSAASFQWYKLQNEVYRREYIGRGKSAAEMTFLVKRLAKDRIENIPTPPSQAEILEERTKMVRRLETHSRGRYYMPDIDSP